MNINGPQIFVKSSSRHPSSPEVPLRGTEVAAAQGYTFHFLISIDDRDFSMVSTDFLFAVRIFSIRG